MLTILRTLIFSAAWIASVTMPLHVHAQSETARSKQKKIAENDRAALQQKLNKLKRSIDQTETAKSAAAEALAKSEQAISVAQRALRDLADEQHKTETRLRVLSAQQVSLQKTVDAQQKRLAMLLREQHIAGNEDRIKLLLSGDNPNRINRNLQYMGYISKAQVASIEALRVNLRTLAENQTDVLHAKAELDEIAVEARDQHAVLQKENAQRATLLAQLSGKLAVQRKEVGNIERDDRRLASLVDKLAVLIQAQRKADVAASEKRRRERIARERRAEEKRQARARQGSRPDEAASGSRVATAGAIEDDEPPSRRAVDNSPTNELTLDTELPTGTFASLRGQLRPPLRGDVLARFGSKRGDGPSWKGWFIKADEGTDVKVVATGRVIYADWLRGFGNLIIVDHGNQYMTIYGNNQSVLKHAGDLVKSGDTIASAGNSGGNEQSGLYFEMRHKGRAFDPQGWVTIR